MKNANHGTLDSAQLKSFVERYMKLDEDAGQISADKAEVLKEAKSAGYDKKMIRKMAGLMKKDPDEIDEEDELTPMYRTALGV